jgi:dienelactone hydrolase
MRAGYLGRRSQTLRMRWYVASCFLAWACLAAGVAMAQPLGTRIEFDSLARGKKEQVWGFLSIPSTSQARYPLMLIMHSSGGIHARDWFFVRKLNDIGVATFVLDSFGPRGLTKVNEDKRSFGDREQAIDALSALATLGKNTRIDLDHLAAMGRSLGGQTAVRLSLKIAREQLPIRGPTLGLALAITPGCTSQPKDGKVTRGTEVWFFLADHDMSPYQRCISYVEKMVAAGGDAHFRVYPETFHTFDGSPKPIWHPREEVYADCSNDRIGPNYSIRLDTGAAIRTKSDWDKFFFGCLKHGAWVGGNPEATRQLDQDWTGAVRRWLHGP